MLIKCILQFHSSFYSPRTAILLPFQEQFCTFIQKLIHLLVFFLCSRWNPTDINHSERSLISSIRVRMKVLKVIILWQIICLCWMSQFRDCPLLVILVGWSPPILKFLVSPGYICLQHCCIYNSQFRTTAPLWFCWHLHDDIKVICHLSDSPCRSLSQEIERLLHFLEALLRNNALWDHPPSKLHWDTLGTYGVWLELDRSSEWRVIIQIIWIDTNMSANSKFGLFQGKIKYVKLFYILYFIC